jgi:hypothetical protein
MMNTIKNVRAHTNIHANDEANKLAQQGIPRPKIIETLFHHIACQTPLRPSIPPTSTQHDCIVRNLNRYIENEHKQPLKHTLQTQYQM